MKTLNYTCIRYYLYKRKNKFLINIIKYEYIYIYYRCLYRIHSVPELNLICTSHDVKHRVRPDD